VSGDGQQPGDVAKGVEVIVDLVCGKGVAEDKDADVPFRLPLGSDCFETVKEKVRGEVEVDTRIGGGNQEYGLPGVGLRILYYVSLY
jgi:hypothetical protein